MRQADLEAVAQNALAAVSVFVAADFVTLTRSPDGDWAAIAEAAKQILAERFD